MDQDSINQANSCIVNKEEGKSDLNTLKKTLEEIIFAFIDTSNKIHTNLSLAFTPLAKSNEKYPALFERNKLLQNNLAVELSNYFSSLLELFEEIEQLMAENSEDKALSVTPLYQYTITSSENIDKDLSLLKLQNHNLREIEFIDIEQYQLYFPSPSLTFTVLERISFTKGKWNPPTTTTIQKPNELTTLFDYYPQLKEILFDKTKIVKANSICSFPLFLSMNLNSFPLIQTLKLERMDLVNSDFISIFNQIILKGNLNKSLQLLSFAGNSITKVNNLKRNSCIDDSIEDETIVFDSLKEINMKDNKLFHFKVDYSAFPQLQLVNLVNNRISMRTEIDFLSKKNKSPALFLCNRNTIFTVQHILNDYIDQLPQVLSGLNYPMSYMTFEGLYNKSNQELFESIKLNEKAFSSLKELNVSNCGLASTAFITFLSHNRHIANLEWLDLSHSMITMSFFQLYLNLANKSDKEKREGVGLLELKYLDLSCNLIEDSSFVSLNDFVTMHPKLTHLKLQLNPFCVNYGADLISEDKLGTIVPESTINQSSTKKNDILDFAVFFNQLYLTKKELHIDFSTESRIIDKEKLKDTDYQVKVKKKR